MIKGPVFSIPDKFLKAFTINGMIRIKFDWFFGDTSGEILNWTNDFYNDLKNTVSEAVKKGGNIYYSTDHLMPEVFNKYPVASKTVAVIGSATPLYEAYIDYFKGKPLTIEYRKIKHNIPKLQTYTFDQAVKKINQNKLKTDCVLCYSSIEHSGLGRYGDYINPEGDFFTMKLVKKMIKPDGLLFLQIPIGSDLLLWNNTRIYGKHRLLLLLEGWKLLDVFGYSPELLDQLPDGSSQDAIFVLQNAKPDNSQQQLFTNEIIVGFQALETNRSLWHKKIKQLSRRFIYQEPKLNPRINYTSPPKVSFKKIVNKIVKLF